MEIVNLKSKLDNTGLNIKIYSTLKFELMQMIIKSEENKDDNLSIYKDDENNIQDIKLSLIHI